MKFDLQGTETIRGIVPQNRQPKLSDRARLAIIAHRAMIERGLEPDFPARALQELASIQKPATPTSFARDLRDRLWSSIDNDDSRDLDQLTLAETLETGHVRILVAIADVDALVPIHSAMDDHAANNTTSIYTPGAIFPMLPVELSTNLTSLNENQDRMAIVIDMVFAVDGSLATADHYLAQVRNHAKLAYRSVGAWLVGAGPMPPQIMKVPGLDANLRLQDRIAQQLANLRQKKGALSLETIEPRAVFEVDTISELEPNWKNRATQLIEDFMIAANGATATHLAAKQFPSIRRVLKSPEKWARIVALASTFGEQLPEQPDAPRLESFLEQRRKVDPEKFPDLSLAVVKLIGRGEYALVLPGKNAPGHFALAVRDYTHSTAPNRRFPDLVTQRLIKASIAGAPSPYSETELADLAKHCTEREGDATKIERRLRKSAGALLLSGRIGETFDSIVTGASDKGTWVRLFRPPTEGRLVRGFEGLDVGDRVRVKLVDTDIERGFIDFERCAVTGTGTAKT